MESFMQIPLFKHPGGGQSNTAVCENRNRNIPLLLQGFTPYMLITGFYSLLILQVSPINPKGQLQDPITQVPPN